MAINHAQQFRIKGPHGLRIWLSEILPPTDRTGCGWRVSRSLRSDRGVQYVSIRYSERLAEAGIEPSVGSIGDSYDNALAESVIGLYKTEVIYRLGPWRSREHVEFETLDWVDWFNNRRLLEPIGYIPPAEFETIYYQSLEFPEMAVGLN